MKLMGMFEQLGVFVLMKARVHLNFIASRYYNTSGKQGRRSIYCSILRTLYSCDRACYKKKIFAELLFRLGYVFYPLFITVTYQETEI